MKSKFIKTFLFAAFVTLAANSFSQTANSYAVIINVSGESRFARETIAMYCTLTEEYGYTDDNIFIHYFDGATNQSSGSYTRLNAKIDYPAYEAVIERTFRNLSGEWTNDPKVPKLSPTDKLFIFITGHGISHDGDSYIYNIEEQPNRIYDYEFAYYLKNINCGQMITVMQNCYSGNFIDEYINTSYMNPACKNRVIHTSTSRWEFSIAENHITGRDYDEFLYYWIAAVRGYYPDENDMWKKGHATGSFPFSNYFSSHPRDYNPDLNGDGIVQMTEAFDYANNFDTWSPYGYFNPYSSIGVYNPKSGVIKENSYMSFSLQSLAVPLLKSAASNHSDFNLLSDTEDLNNKETITGNNNEIEVYPIPAQNNLIINIQHGKNATITLYDMNGRTVFVKRTDKSIENIDCSSIKNGLYNLNINSSGKVFNKKIQIIK